jgi:hypothetical protein
MAIALGLLLTIFGAVPIQDPAVVDADDVLAQLSSIRLNKEQIFRVREVTIRRDVLSITLNRGAIAFLQPVLGKVSGVVFIGSGEIVAIPPNSIERQQVSRFTGTPILNETFQAGIFRFTDGTYDEIKKEISDRAVEDLSPDDLAQFDAWDPRIAERVNMVNLRLLPDFLEPVKRPFFLAELNGDKTGWFSVALDFRSAEEVSAYQIRDSGGVSFVDVWASFNQRSEAKNPEAVAHENKSPVDITEYAIEPATGRDNQPEMRARLRVAAREEGTRVLNIDLPPSSRLISVASNADPNVPIREYPNSRGLTVVLQTPLKRGAELTLTLGASSLMDNARILPDEGAPTEIRNFFSDFLGPYPHSRLTIAQSDSNAPPQNWPMFIRIPSNSDAAAFEFTLAQEIARQWLGKRTMPASYHDHWLFEGLTRYLGAMYVEHKHPGGGLLNKLLGDAREVLAAPDTLGPIWLGQRLETTISPGGYRSMQSKSMWVIHMLRMMLAQTGTNPDAQFFAILRELVENYGTQTVSTWDFKRLVEKHMSPTMDLRGDKKLDWFFDEWVFGMGIPHYDLDYNVEASGGEFVVEGKVKQTGVPDEFIMAVPIYADGEFIERLTVGDSDVAFRFRLPRRPERITIDAQGVLLTAVRQ